MAHYDPFKNSGKHYPEEGEESEFLAEVDFSEDEAQETSNKTFGLLDSFFGTNGDR